jgi:hypothetical protein
VLGEQHFAFGPRPSTKIPNIEEKELKRGYANKLLYFIISHHLLQKYALPNCPFPVGPSRILPTLATTKPIIR